MSASPRQRKIQGVLFGAAIVALAGGAAFVFSNAEKSPKQPAEKPPSAPAPLSKPAPPPPEEAPTPAPGGSAEAPKAPPAPLKAVRQIPRKKLPEVSLDLDGDGKKELLLLKQTQPAKDWKGKDKTKGPRFVLEVRKTTADGKPGALLGKKERYGWGQGWGQIGVRTGGGAHVALAYWSVPEEHAPKATYGYMEDGEVKWNEFKRLPLDLLDLHFAKMETVLTLSQELYHDFLKRGTTDLLMWEGGRFLSSLERPMFEICVAAVREPQVIFAGVKQDKKTLLLFHFSPGEFRRIHELWSTAVKPPTEGPAYSVPSGFALSCDRATGIVQYKQRRFKIDGEQLIALPDAPAVGAKPAAKRPPAQKPPSAKKP